MNYLSYKIVISKHNCCKYARLKKDQFVPDWNCALCSPRTEIVGPCNIAAAVDADDLLTSLIGIGVNGVNELPVYIKQTKKPKMSNDARKNTTS